MSKPVAPHPLTICSKFLLGFVHHRVQDRAIAAAFSNIRHALQVTEGSGSVLVVAVGENSEWGKTMALVRTESADTPLQDSLGSLAAAIGKLGLAVGSLCFVVLTIRCAAAWCWKRGLGDRKEGGLACLATSIQQLPPAHVFLL